jgi:TRAP-type mannitol/chloroaromatic compound transport system substrate-binding protein
MRIPGFAGEVMRRLGAVPQGTAPGDIYPSLERGTIDAAELSGPMDDENTALYRVAKFYYYPGWQELSAATNLFINKQRWDELPASYKAILQAVAAEATREMIVEYDTGNAAALRRLAAAGAEFRALPKEVLDALYRVTQELLEENAAKNPEFERIYRSWLPFRKDLSTWLAVAETPAELYIQRALRD